MSARHPSWDTTPACRAMWDHTAAQGTPTLLDALDIVDAIPREATTDEHHLTRLVMIDVLEARHNVNPIVDEDLEHLWDDEDDAQSYVDVLRAAIAHREAVAAVPVARAEAYAAKLIADGVLDPLAMSDIAILDALAGCGRRPLRAEVPAIRAAYPAQRDAAARFEVTR